MRVGIITFHRAVNYGAVFQTYALKTVLEKRAYQVEVLDYRCDYLEQPYNRGVQYKKLKEMFTDILLYQMRKRKQKVFDEFVEHRIKPVPLSSIEKMDAVITGSDQVWNCELTDSDMTYFLGGEIADYPVRRIAYAVCTGKKRYSSQKAEQIAELLAKVDSIAVRDDNSAEIIGELSAGTIIKTVDPTMLMDAGEWAAQIPENKYGNFVLVFCVGFSNRLADFAQDLARKTNKQIIFINSTGRRRGKGTYLDTAAPEEALNLICSADFVVTNSFHGIAMSLVLNKELFVELDHKKKGRNHRGECLLNDFGVIGREIHDNKYYEKKYLPLKWDEINRKIDKAREHSFEYLFCALQDNKGSD